MAASSGRARAKGSGRAPAKALARGAGLSDVFLVVDSRESSVAPFLDSEVKEHAYVSRQINTGDYLICRRRPGGAPPQVLACLERKTLKDFAASFTDGRYENLRKMLDLRAATGCQLFFLVEGPAFPSPGRRFGPIPYSSILSAITKLMVRDRVFVDRTENEAHTAKRLADFLRVFDLPECAARDAGAPTGDAADAAGQPPAGDAARDGAADVVIDVLPEAETKVARTDSGVVDPLGFDVPASLTARLEPTDDEAVVLMWARLRGISAVLGKLISLEFSAADLATERVSVERVCALRTAGRRPANKDAIASLLAVRSGALEFAAKIVSGARGVTPAVAETILNALGGLARLCAASVTTLADVGLPREGGKTARLGKARAERILRLVHYRCPGSDPGPGPSAPAPTPEPARAPRPPAAAAKSPAVKPSAARSRTAEPSVSSMKSPAARPSTAAPPVSATKAATARSPTAAPSAATMKSSAAKPSASRPPNAKPATVTAARSAAAAPAGGWPVAASVCSDDDADGFALEELPPMADGDFDAALEELV